MTAERVCIWTPCVATWRHWHGGFPGGYDNPADPEGPPIAFEGDDPDPTAVRDYNGAPLRTVTHNAKATYDYIDDAGRFPAERSEG